MDVKNKYSLKKKNIKKQLQTQEFRQNEEIDKLKQSFYEKIFKDLKLRNHRSLDFYDFKKFTLEFTKEIDKISNENMKSDYNTILNLVEKMIIENENNFNLKFAKKETIASPLNEKISTNHPTLQPNNYIHFTNCKSTLLRELEQKKNDDWAKIIQIEQKRLNNLMERKQMEIFKEKETLRLDLIKQIEAKRMMEKIKKEEERKLERDLIEIDDNKYRKDIENFDEKIKRNRLYYDKIIEENKKNLRFKKEIIDEENLYEQKILNKSKSILQEEERKNRELILKKKKDEIELKKFLENQIAEKEKQKENEQKSKFEERKIHQKLSEEVFKDKHDRCVWYRISQKNYKQLLDNQIQSKQIIPMMSEEERKINKRFFEEILR